MILVDANENRNQPDLVNILRQSVDVEVAAINQTAGSAIVWPDFVIQGGDKLVGINRKTVGEWLGSSDKVIEQVQRELAGPVEHLVLVIEGIMTDIPGLGMMAYDVDWGSKRLFQMTRGTVTFSQRAYHVNPKHAQNEQTRLEFLGVQVVHTYSTQDTASKLIAFHDLLLKGEPNRVLDRLIKADIAVFGLTPEETAMAKTLMGVANGGIGETIALTIAASFSTIWELMTYWLAGGSIADMMLLEKANVRTRRIGTAAELKLQRALGWQAASSNSVAQPGQSTQESDSSLMPVSGTQ